MRAGDRDSVARVMRVRPAVGTDATSVAALLAELGYPDNTPSDVAERLDAWGDEPNGRLGYEDRCGRSARFIKLL
jgi:hypothetical protein